MLTQGEPRRVARGRDRGGGRLGEETVLAAVCWLTYLRTKSERLLPVNAGTKSINYPSANERKKEEGRSIGRVALRRRFRGVAWDDEVSYRKIEFRIFFFSFFPSILIPFFSSVDQPIHPPRS